MQDVSLFLDSLLQKKPAPLVLRGNTSCFLPTFLAILSVSPKTFFASPSNVCALSFFPQPLSFFTLHSPCMIYVQSFKSHLQNNEFQISSLDWSPELQTFSFLSLFLHAYLQFFYSIFIESLLCVWHYISNCQLHIFSRYSRDLKLTCKSVVFPQTHFSLLHCLSDYFSIHSSVLIRNDFSDCPFSLLYMSLNLLSLINSASLDMSPVCTLISLSKPPLQFQPSSFSYLDDSNCPELVLWLPVLCFSSWGSTLQPEG